MASVLGKMSLMLFGLVMMAVGGTIGLLVIILELIMHPFTFFKKIPRSGELLRSKLCSPKVLYECTPAHHNSYTVQWCLGEEALIS